MDTIPENGKVFQVVIGKQYAVPLQTGAQSLRPAYGTRSITVLGGLQVNVSICVDSGRFRPIAGVKSSLICQEYGHVTLKNGATHV